MLKGDVVQALRSTRAVRLSGLTLGVAALAATGLLAGGRPSHGPAASATASAAVRATTSAAVRTTTSRPQTTATPHPAPGRCTESAVTCAPARASRR